MARKKIVTVQTRIGEQAIDTAKIIVFPRGLVGYEHCRKFTLLQLRPDSPFLVLQSLDSPELGLLVADPYGFVSDYNVRLAGAEQSLLRVTDVSQVTVLVTVTIPHGKPERTAISLIGPILINHESRLGLQVPQADGLFPSQVFVYQQGEAQTAETPAAGADAPNAKQAMPAHNHTADTPTDVTSSKKTE